MACSTLYNIHLLFTRLRQKEGYVFREYVILCNREGAYCDLTQTWNNNLRVTQRVAPWGNQTRDTLHSSQFHIHCANRALKLIKSVELDILMYP
ncbi:hypothetical protein SFRURICE_014495 [Spodoptera frugiperda]|nr:hypothetical protein SFRURICE_020885 [Spodoptera frugiperda]KAF9804587.1 hypothetical protein SFRURICE_014495 [Spodoptera frugiperda]